MCRNIHEDCMFKGFIYAFWAMEAVELLGDPISYI